MIRAKLTALILSAIMAQAATAAPVPDMTAQSAEPELEYIGMYRVTAYNYEEGDGENFATAGGYEPIPYWTCAASDDIDLGTVLYIEGIGEVQVQDRGAFPDGIIDLHIGWDPIEGFDDREREVYLVQRR